MAGDFEFSFPKETNKELDIQAILDENVNESYFLTEKEIHWIETWEDFLKNVNTESQLPGHPIWAESFFGDEPLDNLPDWKQDFIRKNRKLYAENMEFIDGWLERWGVLDENEDGKRKYPVSRTKYEWQAGPDSRSNWENLIQFRPSGIRVKRPNYFPALVAMAQIPVVGWERRHITPKECARIQNFDVEQLACQPGLIGGNHDPEPCMVQPGDRLQRTVDR